MAPPAHVKAVVGFVQTLLLLDSLGGVLPVSSPLPPLAVFGAAPSSSSLPDVALALLLAGAALAKLVTVFSNPEGTFLRRNLFAAFGIADLAICYACCQASVTKQGVALFGVEGAALLHDALLRPRSAAKAKK